MELTRVKVGIFLQIESMTGPGNGAFQIAWHRVGPTETILVMTILPA